MAARSWSLLLGALLGRCTAAPAPRVQLRSWPEAEFMADRTLEQMTPVEKAALLQGVGWIRNPTTHEFALLDGMYAGNTLAVQRLGVPFLKMHDGASGFKTSPTMDGSVDALGTSTVFPSPLALAATWDEDMVARVAAAVAEEFRTKGANVLLGPAVQVHRVAKNGRNYEYLSGEDPYLGARLAAAYVTSVQEAGVLACAKHFAFHEQELNMFGQNSVVDERTAWELYYPPFEAAVQAGVGCVMCTRTLVNGTRACESPVLLETHLKRKMHFRGFVMSDWWANLATPPGNGLDLEMPGTLCQKSMTCDLPGVPAGHLPGMLSPALPVDMWPPARRILAAVYRLRLDAAPGCELGPSCQAAMQADTTGEEHRELALEAASRSAVLLKNVRGALPIDPARVKRLALVGYAIDSPQNHNEIGYPPPDYYSGGGTGHVGAGAGLVTPRDGIEDRARAAGIEVISRSTIMVSTSLEVARRADLTVFVGATSSMENADRPSLTLDFWANDLIAKLADVGPVVVLMQTPGAVFTPWRDHPNVTAIANLFLAGEQTGKAWGGLLFGDFNPSGKLPVSFPKFDNATIEPAPETVLYSEGLETSYRHPRAEELAAFPFGHGLSFTEFRYGALSQLVAEACASAPRAWREKSDVVACLGLNVSNVGKRSGAEVAQAYVEFAQAADMPRLMLKGFHRTRALAPGESELALFAFTARDLSTYEVSLGDWNLQRHLTVHVGSSSADLRRSLELSLPDVVAGGTGGGEPVGEAPVGEAPVGEAPVGEARAGRTDL